MNRGGTFVSVGNAHQSFDRMLRMVKNVMPKLPQPVTVQFGHTQFASSECERISFLPMDAFLTRMRQAELVIVHAGAGSVIHAIATGKVPVVVPRRKHLLEHIDEHQVEFALALAGELKAVVAMEDADLLRLSAQALEMQHNQSPVAHRVPSMARAVKRALEELNEGSAVAP
jgi:UDP-N-acetylglucosamine transferase subunit ALG13